MDDTELPDIVVVVMDCVRTKEFNDAVDRDIAGLADLRTESVSFRSAASVAPWTLPAHASLFSGLYPWEHGCHGKGVLQLPPQITRIPQWLKPLGYRTYSVSGNPIIGASYGFLDGFDRAAWGEWWERAYRVLEAPPNMYEGPQPPSRVATAPSLPRRVARTFTTAAQRTPFTLALDDSLLHHLKQMDPEVSGSLNPWIEPTLQRWLKTDGDGAPTFSFVNFIDAHEPYLNPGNGSSKPYQWWKSLRIPQDSLALLSGEFELTDEDSELLRNMYQNSVQRLARRVGRLVQFLKGRGRWRNTLFLLTSDHGQAFGEGGVVWHGLRADEEELRVPLWIKFPGDIRPASQGVGWASPLDAAATILQATGQPHAGLPHSIPLQELTSRERPEPLLAASDGVTWNAPLCARLSSARVADLDRIFGAGYLGDSKVIIDVGTGSTRAYDIAADPGCHNDTWPAVRTRMETLVSLARAAGLAVLKSPVPAHSVVEDRLHAWGYM